MDNELVEAVARSFAWTPGAGSYKQYPPYVNVTGNRLTVRGTEQDGAIGDQYFVQPGPTVSIELPDEVIADLSAALAATPLASLKAENEEAASVLRAADDIICKLVGPRCESEEVRVLISRLRDVGCKLSGIKPATEPCAKVANWTHG